MRDFSLADETIDLNRSSSYILSIQINLNGFSFSILDTVRNKYSLLKHYDIPGKLTTDNKGGKIEEILSKDTSLQNPFKKVNCLCVNPKSMLIPSPLFDEQYIKRYFDFNQPLNELEELHYHYLKKTDSYNVFSVPNPVTNALLGHFPKIHFYHHSYSLINYHINFIEEDKTYVGLNLYDNFIDILVIDNKKLIFFNSFEFQNHDDILYYVLNVYHQLDLDPETIELKMTGTNFKHEQLIKELKEYIKKIHHLKPPKEVTYSYLFKKEMLYYYFNLFNLIMCE